MNDTSLARVSRLFLQRSASVCLCIVHVHWEQKWLDELISPQRNLYQLSKQSFLQHRLKLLTHPATQHR